MLPITPHVHVGYSTRRILGPISMLAWVACISQLMVLCMTTISHLYCSPTATFKGTQDKRSNDETGNWERDNTTLTRLKNCVAHPTPTAIRPSRDSGKVFDRTSSSNHQNVQRSTSHTRPAVLHHLDEGLRAG